MLEIYHCNVELIQAFGKFPVLNFNAYTCVVAFWRTESSWPTKSPNKIVGQLIMYEIRGFT